MTKTFIHIPSNSGPSLYRATLPVLHCYHELSQHGIQLVGDFQPLENEFFDVYLFHRVFKPDFWEFVQIIIDSGKKVIWQTDDDLWNVPESNPIHEKITDVDRLNLTKIKEKCHTIFTSTQPLADLIDKPDKTYVLPNLVDLTFFKLREFENTRPIKILWAGSASHNEDLQQVTEIIIKLIEEYGRDIQFIFLGYFPTELAMFERVPGKAHAKLVPKYPCLSFIPWNEGRTYFDVLNHIKPDIALAPLTNHVFNYSKSGIKYLEMTMAGATFIGTKLPPYDWIEDEEEGLLVRPDDKDGWYWGIKRLIEDFNFRIRLMVNAQKKVREEWSWQSNKRKIWTDAIIDTVSRR